MTKTTWLMLHAIAFGVAVAGLMVQDMWVFVGAVMVFLLLPNSSVINRKPSEERKRDKHFYGD